MSLVAEVKQVIEAALPGAEVTVLDPLNDATHLEAIVISEKFEGVSLVKQHQMVMKPLSTHFATALHALGLKTFTPSGWSAHTLKQKEPVGGM
jgi:acid stress-induced BolA-like protein IbaG/YrbA